MLVRVRFDVPSGSSSSKKEEEKEKGEKRKRKYITEVRSGSSKQKTSEVWGNKFDFKAISKRKVHGLPDI